MKHLLIILAVLVGGCGEKPWPCGENYVMVKRGDKIMCFDYVETAMKADLLPSDEISLKPPDK